MKPLTDKQKNVLRLIAEKAMEVGYPPTLQELADELGVASKNAVLKHLTALGKKGYIGKREGGAARGIRILESLGYLGSPDVSSVPLVGSVPAGSPLLAEENIDRYVSIPIEVITFFQDGRLHPLRFKWKGEVYKITKVNNRWSQQIGLGRQVHFSVTANSPDCFELVFDTADFGWQLARVFWRGKKVDRDVKPEIPHFFSFLRNQPRNWQKSQPI